MSNLTLSGYSYMEQEEKAPVGAGGFNKGKQLRSAAKPLPGQILTFQRGLARAALELPEEERESSLREALEAMGLLKKP